jgi:hypothetical protein
MKKSKNKTMTYYGSAKTRKDAEKNAKKIGASFSELVEKLLQGFNEGVFMIQKTYERNIYLVKDEPVIVDLAGKEDGI